MMCSDIITNDIQCHYEDDTYSVIILIICIINDMYY